MEFEITRLDCTYMYTVGSGKVFGPNQRIVNQDYSVSPWVWIILEVAIALVALFNESEKKKKKNETTCSSPWKIVLNLTGPRYYNQALAFTKSLVYAKHTINVKSD